MERFAQYLDDLDDLFGMVGLIGERLRSLFAATLFCLLLLTVAAIAAQLAVLHPPLALATSILLMVTLLYRAVTLTPHNASHSA